MHFSRTVRAVPGLSHRPLGIRMPVRRRRVSRHDETPNFARSGNGPTAQCRRRGGQVALIGGALMSLLSPHRWPRRLSHPPPSPSPSPGAAGCVHRSTLEVIIPAFNESARLPRPSAERRLPERAARGSAGSSSSTTAVSTRPPRYARVAAVATDKVDVVVIGCSRAGKGAAVRRGLLTSTSPLVGFYRRGPRHAAGDARRDRRGPPVRRATASSRPGTRPAPASWSPQPLRRRRGGDVFRAAGPHARARRRATPSAGSSSSAGAVVQTAIAACADHRLRLRRRAARARCSGAGGKIVEIPVAWTDAAGSTFRPVRDGLASFRRRLRASRELPSDRDR